MGRVGSATSWCSFNIRQSALLPVSRGARAVKLRRDIECAASASSPGRPNRLQLLHHHQHRLINLLHAPAISFNISVTNVSPERTSLANFNCATALREDAIKTIIVIIINITTNRNSTLAVILCSTPSCTRRVSSSALVYILVSPLSDWSTFLFSYIIRKIKGFILKLSFLFA